MTVIFTNQAGVESGKTKVADLEAKFGAIQKQMEQPLLFVVSTLKDSPYRKPNKGMWKVMLEVLER